MPFICITLERERKFPVASFLRSGADLAVQILIQLVNVAALLLQAVIVTGLGVGLAGEVGAVQVGSITVTGAGGRFCYFFQLTLDLRIERGLWFLR